ncbi:MAG: toxin TcdB middle/C-terminal domain-containing protein, partial [Kofleriaceae bacterium]
QPRETLAYHYERDPSDPRIAHELVTAVSPSGAVVDKVSIAYSRRGVTIDPSHLTRTSAQGLLLATLAHVELRDAAVAAETHRLDIPVREDLFELVGLPVARVLDFAEVVRFVAAAQEQPYTPHRRLADRLAFAAGKHVLQRSWHRYYDDAQRLLDRGEVGVRALAARTEMLAHTSATLAPIVAREPTLDLTPLLASPAYGYLHDPDDTYWAPSAQVTYDVDHFFVAIAATNPFGGVARVELDPLYALPIRTLDVMANPTVVTNDYRLFAPQAVTDPNHTTASVEVDTRGIVVATDLRQGALGGQLTAIDYAFYDPLTGAPPRVHALGFPDYRTGTAIPEESWLYSDSTGREALRKIRVPPAPGTIDPRGVGWGLHAEGTPTRLALDADVSHLAEVTSDGTLHVFDLISHRVLYERMYAKHALPVWITGNRLLMFRGDAVEQLDPRTGATEKVAQVPPASYGVGTDDGTRVAILGSEGEAGVYDVAKKTWAPVWAGHKADSIEYAADGSWLAVSDAQGVAVFDAAGAQIAEHAGRLMMVASSPHRLACFDLLAKPMKLLELDLGPTPAWHDDGVQLAPRAVLIAAHYRGEALVVVSSAQILHFIDHALVSTLPRADYDVFMAPNLYDGIDVAPSRDGTL